MCVRQSGHSLTLHGVFTGVYRLLAWIMKDRAIILTHVRCMHAIVSSSYHQRFAAQLQDGRWDLNEFRNTASGGNLKPIFLRGVVFILLREL